jgi:hypothetical protein
MNYEYIFFYEVWSYFEYKPRPILPPWILGKKCAGYTCVNSRTLYKTQCIWRTDIMFDCCHSRSHAFVFVRKGFRCASSPFGSEAKQFVTPVFVERGLFVHRSLRNRWFQLSAVFHLGPILPTDVLRIVYQNFFDMCKIKGKLSLRSINPLKPSGYYMYHMI